MAITVSSYNGLGTWSGLGIHMLFSGAWLRRIANCIPGGKEQSRAATQVHWLRPRERRLQRRLDDGSPTISF